MNKLKDSSFIDVCVRNPFTHNTWEKGRFTSYEITIQTNLKSFCLQCSTTRRRFKEFEWIHKCLKQHHPLEALPALPPKKFFGERFEPSFIAFRMKSLEEYLKKLLKQDLYISDETLHLFLQSNLTTTEIDKFLMGQISTNAIEELWNKKGDKSKCRYFNGFESISQNEEDSEIPYLNDDDSLSDDEPNSKERDVEASVTDADYPCVTLVLPNHSSTSPLDKLHKKMTLLNSMNTSAMSSDSISWNTVDSANTSTFHAINGDP